MAAAQTRHLTARLALPLVAVRSLPHCAQAHAQVGGDAAVHVAVVVAQRRRRVRQVLMQVQQAGASDAAPVVQLVAGGTLCRLVLNHLAEVLDEGAIGQLDAALAAGSGR